MLKIWSGLLLISASLLCNVAVMAETVYVSDTLRVGVRPEADNRVAPIGVVTTGMQLEVLERSNGYLRIKAPNGTKGWIKDIYVIKQLPAVIQLEQALSQQKNLKKQLSEMQETNKILEQANLKLNEKVDRLESERSKWQMERVRVQASEVVQAPDSTWVWWMLGVLVLGLSGFLGGISWYRQHVAKRLGGLRV